MNRLLFLLHRYLGIALGLIVSIWCLSGIVMMYVEYPELAPEDEARTLQMLELESCCLFPAGVELDASSSLDEVRVEMMAGTPVLRLEHAMGELQTINLATGQLIDRLDRGAADAVAAAYAQTAGIESFQFEGQLARDQWSVYGAYDAHRPLFKYSGNDAAGTDWYISSRTGEIVQVTTASERFWNWLGAVPHWLYPTLLRQHTAVWAQTVIWLTIVGTFLTVFGVYVGLRQFKSRRSGRYSPYRGASLWHHYAGLATGLLMLSWLISGFFSMNPWGALESRSFVGEIERNKGAALTLDQGLQSEIRSLAEGDVPENAVRMQAHLVNGERFFVTWDAAGRRHRANESLADLGPFVRDTLLAAANRIRPNAEVAEQGWIDNDDAYYYSHSETRPLPVYRIIYADGERFYLDALTGDIAYAVDTNRKLYRWLHYALHRGDFSAFIRERPNWDVFMLPLLLGVSLSALTGTWMGLRRVMRWLRSKERITVPARSQHLVPIASRTLSRNT